MTVMSRIAAGVVAAAALGAMLTACSSTPSATPTTTSTPATTTSRPSGAGVSPAAGRTLQFPDKDLSVVIDGYDNADRMVEFHLAVWVPGGPDDGSWRTDPNNTAAHRLALAPDASIVALTPDCTGPSKGNLATDGAQCTLAQYLTALTDQTAVGPTKLHVNAADQIQTVQGVYHP